MSLRLKIAALSTLISGAILIGFGIASWYLICHDRLAAVDREIRTLAARHPGWLANRASYERLTSMLEFTFGEQRKDQVILLIRDREGTELYRSPHWPFSLAPEKLPITLEDDPSAPKTGSNSGARPPLEHSGPPWGPGSGLGRMGRGYGWGPGGPPAFTKAARFMTAKAGDAMWRVGVFGNAQATAVLGINYDAVQGELNRLRDAFLLALPVALVLVGVGGWIIGTRALRPLKVIADTADRVTARGLDHRIPLAGSDQEVVRVVRVLNGMMDRLEKSFHQATRFTADASHELKTPLAIMQGELDNALQAAPVGSAEQQVFSTLLEETQRLKNITRNLLLLAQADSGQLKLSMENIDLTELLQNAIEDARVLAADLNLAFDIHVEPNLRTFGDPHLLSTAVHNVLGNAVKYNDRDGRMVVHARFDGRQIEVIVGNSGPGIRELDQSHLFERFFRGHQLGGRQPEGSGLGLSLAREIFRAHESELALQESRLGWTAFVVRLKDATECRWECIPLPSIRHQDKGGERQQSGGLDISN
jgi:two-component system heavy metal sensor histidine kinase CusS